MPEDVKSLADEIRKMREELESSERKVKPTEAPLVDGVVARSVMGLYEASKQGLDEQTQKASVKKATRAATGVEYDGLGRLRVKNADDEVAKALQGSSFLMDSGADVVNYEGQSAEVIVWDEPISGAWAGEHRKGSEENPSFRRVTLSSKLIHVDIPIPRSLQGERSILNHIEMVTRKGFGNSIDNAFCQSMGTDGAPFGLPSWLTSAQTVTGTWSADDPDDIEDDIIDALGYLEDNECLDAESKLVAISNYATRRFLRKQRDSDLHKYFPLIKEGKLLDEGMSYFASNQCGAEKLWVIDADKMRIGIFNGGLDMRVLNETRDSKPRETTIRIDMEVGFLSIYGGRSVAAVETGSL